MILQKLLYIYIVATSVDAGSGLCRKVFWGFHLSAIIGLDLQGNPLGYLVVGCCGGVNCVLFHCSVMCGVIAIVSENVVCVWSGVPCFCYIVGVIEDSL